MGIIDQSLAHQMLKNLIGQPLCYGIKSPDLDLYDFGFGEHSTLISNSGKVQHNSTYALHATCSFRIIPRNHNIPASSYTCNSSPQRFNTAIEQIIGLCVSRVALSEKNDLWLDLGLFWIVFISFENDIEAWRFFATDHDTPHLVASGTWIRLD